MFSKIISLLFFTCFAILVAAAPGGTPISQCNTGDAQCCNQVQKASSGGVGLLLGLLGIVLQDLNVLVGLGCTPINVIGVGGGVDCSQHPVCCENNHFEGLINIGCSPITL